MLEQVLMFVLGLVVLVVGADVMVRGASRLAVSFGVSPLVVGLTVVAFGTGKIADDKIVALIGHHFDLRPKAIIQTLDLLRPIYSRTAAYGHFGRDEPEFTWEQTDKAAALRADAGL